MAFIKRLITDKKLGNKNTIKRQILSAAMAWQILNDYPAKGKSFKSGSWKIYRNLRGVLLADEVGCGKTFEALSIISKALLEKNSLKKRFRVLIIANPSIRSKWLWDDKENNFVKFQRRKPKSDLGIFIQQTAIDNKSKKNLFNFFSKQYVMKKGDWGSIEKELQGVWVTSFQGLPVTKGSNIHSEFRKAQKKNQFPESFFDWIIVDEAHALKSGNKDIDESIQLVNSAIRKIYAVLNASKKAKLILLTATPFQNNKAELKHLLSLIEKNDGKSNPPVITELIARGIDKVEKEIAGLNGGEIFIDNIKVFKRKFGTDINQLLDLSESNKVKRPKVLCKGDVKDGLDDFLRDIMVRNTKDPLKIEPQVAKMGEKEKLQYLLFRDLVKITETETQMFSTKLSQLVSGSASFAKNNIDKNLYRIITELFEKNLIFAAKRNRLLETIRQIRFSNDKYVITVFVSWKDTVDELEGLFRECGYKLFKLTGDTPTDERKKTLNKIDKANRASKKLKKPLILLASRVGNEGLDFDSFCNRVIHYDNNFNPAVIDQRNGRVYRSSNIRTKRGKITAKDIRIFQLFLDETYDQRILFIEQEKRKLKNFYLGDGSLQVLLEKTIRLNNLSREDELLNLINSISIDLTPKKGNILKKYHKEIL